MKSNSFNSLKDKLEAYIRKYYKNRIIRGSLFFTGSLLSVFLLLVFAEQILWLSPFWRSVLFFGFVGLSFYFLLLWLIIPLLKLNQIGQRLSYEQAARLIGQHFPEVNDRLLNTLQLENQLEERSEEDVFLAASIDQKIALLKPVPFANAINFKENYKYLRWVAIPMLMLLFISAISPDWISKPASRLVRFNEEFVPEAPFQVNIKNQSLQATQFEDFNLSVETQGKLIPKELFLEIGNQRFRMNQERKNSFYYLFNQVQRNLEFRFVSGEYTTQTYLLKVVPRPVIKGMTVKLDYPDYLNKKDEVLSDRGDFTVPEGTKLAWVIEGEHIDQLQLLWSGKPLDVRKIEGSNRFESKLIIRQSGNYLISTSNNQSSIKDSAAYAVIVTKDEYPAIRMFESADSLNKAIRYFEGEIADDYGISQLLFRYRTIVDDNKKAGNWTTTKLPFQANNLQQRVLHFFDIEALSLPPGQTIEYFFEVYDNDGVNGAKSSRTETFRFRQESVKEMEKATETRSDQIASSLKEAVKETKKIQQEAEQLRKKLRDKQDLSWEDKKAVDQLLKKQQQIEKTLEEVKQLSEQNLKQMEKTDPEEQQLLEKQKELQEMLEKTLNDDLKKLIEEIQKLQENKADPAELQKQLDNMKVDNKDLQKELDRMLEFFKELAVEQKMDKVMEKLDDLANRQEKLSQDDQSSKEEQLSKQEELNKDFKDLKEELKDLKEKNEQLESPKDMGEMEKESSEIEQEMKSGQENLNKGQQKAAKKNQKQAAQKMQQMSANMKQRKQQQEQEEMQEDMRALRMLLDNLVKLSFAQEGLIDRLKDNTQYGPIYVKIAHVQFKLKEDARLIEDSLQALSKRVMQLNSFITKEVTDMNQHLEASIQALGTRNTPLAKVKQQYVMTSVNNLAVMLSEVLKQMQQQQQQQQQGQGSCAKPGKKKPGGGALSKLQKQLNEDLQKLKEGQKPGQQSPKPGQRQSGQGKEFAQMVARQQAIRRELQKLNEQLKKEGKGGKPEQGQIEKALQEMEKTERELLNKSLSQETLNRQQDILTRLLESEKAERERGEEETRKSNTADQNILNRQRAFEQFKLQKQRDTESLKSISLDLQPFYRQKVDGYMNNLLKKKSEGPNRF